MKRDLFNQIGRGCDIKGCENKKTHSRRGGGGGLRVVD